MSVALLSKHKKKASQRLNCFTPLHPSLTSLSFGRNNVAALLDCYPSPLMIFFSIFYSPCLNRCRPPPVAPVLWGCHKAEHNEATLTYINVRSPAQSVPSSHTHQTTWCISLPEENLSFVQLYLWMAYERGLCMTVLTSQSGVHYCP